MPETVNHPSYYNTGIFETIEVIRDTLTPDQFTGFCLGTALRQMR